MDRQELLNINKNRKMEVEKSYHSEFDFNKYEITDERVIREVTQTEEDIRQIGKFMAKKALEIGRKLKRVQEILSSHGTGTFVAWFTSLGLDKNMVYREINRWEQFEKYRNPAIAEASVRTLEYIKKNNDKLEEAEIVEILEDPVEAAKKIKEIEKKGKEETEINFDEKIQKLSEKIEKAYRNIEKWEMEIKKLKGRNDDFEKD
ncbi:hypothetical protein JCM16775_0710 [Leptotrichia hofstadii]|uniref:Uncharacterized protein n=1 Tax=Leptotrichia hofstadii TaxID=157688 RepID=A0A510JJI3_9FUSO|nr:hypothetical protein [Leptotrichia hofstadii]BBM38003.1 hypothetical protein JCM16775_0710 [Leptotrichia hofstadii]